jgi:hypothetical protein
MADLRARRGALVERARSERVELGRIVDAQRPWLGTVEAGLAAVRYCSRQKHLLVVAAFAFALVRPRRALRWALRGLSLYQLARKLRRKLPLSQFDGM